VEEEGVVEKEVCSKAQSLYPTTCVPCCEQNLSAFELVLAVLGEGVVEGVEEWGKRPVTLRLMMCSC
jgi:hypothetical protein